MSIDSVIIIIDSVIVIICLGHHGHHGHHAVHNPMGKTNLSTDLFNNFELYLT